LAVSKRVELIKVLFFVSSIFLDLLDILSDYLSIGDVFSLDFATLIDLSSLEFVLLNGDLELLSLSIEILHFLVKFIPRWLLEDFLGELWNLGIDSNIDLLEDWALLVLISPLP
jgi:hypothetical protein